MPKTNKRSIRWFLKKERPIPAPYPYFKIDLGIEGPLFPEKLARANEILSKIDWTNSQFGPKAK